ncbi:MAG: hypothetical protein WBO44_04750 [Saprospiraceae bacterium]
MKHFISFSKVGLLLAVVFAAFFSCSKEKKDNFNSSEKKQININDVPVNEAIEKINLFKEKEVLNSRTSEYYNTEEALWLIEAISNSNHGNARLHHSKLFISSHQLFLTIQNNVITNQSFLKNTRIK